MGRLRRVAPMRTAAVNRAVYELPPSQFETPSTKNHVRFRLFGVSPIWGECHRDLLKHPHNCGAQKTVWAPESGLELLGLTLIDSNTPRVPSAWGNLISGDATSDPSVLSLEAFQARRIPIGIPGGTLSGAVAKQLQKLMIAAPSEFPSLYWGHAGEFKAAGVSLLSGAHAVDCPIPESGRVIRLYNAGQTTRAAFFSPDACVAYTPLLVPEMKREYAALKYYWNVVGRGRVNCADEWFAQDLVKSHRIKLRNNARCVGERYNMGDFENLSSGQSVKLKLKRERAGP